MTKDQQEKTYPNDLSVFVELSLPACLRNCADPPTVRYGFQPIYVLHVQEFRQNLCPAVFLHLSSVMETQLSIITD